MDIVITDPNRRSNPYLNRITLVQGDITRQDVDAIVTFIPQNLEYRGEINRCILKEAGEKSGDILLGTIFFPRAGGVVNLSGVVLHRSRTFFFILPFRRLATALPARGLVEFC